LFWLIVAVVNHSIFLVVADFYAITIHGDIWELVIAILSLLHVQWEVLVVSCLVDWLVVDLRPLQDSFEVLVLGIEHFGNIALKLFFFRLDILDGERDNSSTNLDCHGMMSLESQLVFKQDDCTKLGCIVLNVEPILFTLDNCVTSAHTDVVNSHLTFMTSS